ncbi:MAG TPA: PKD domain-containing protein [Flavobacteriales bacterium]|nr:PKD domain-containing protein [Flavobacteriales bacterium]
MDALALVGEVTTLADRMVSGQEGFGIVKNTRIPFPGRPGLAVIILLVALASMAGNSHAQTFHKTLGTPTANEYGQCVQASPDGNFFVGGSKGDSALIMKVGPMGNVLWSMCTRPIPVYKNVIFHLEPAPDGNMIATGNGQESPALGYGHTFILKFDLDGNVLWATRPPVDRAIWTHRTLPVSGSEYMLLSEVYDMGSPTFPDLFTARLDATTGALIAHSPLLDYIPTNSYIDDIRCATKGLGGNVYIGGRIYLNGSAPTGMRPFITKFDPTGTHLWSKYLMFPNTASARVYGSDIAFTGDSLILSYFGDLNGASTNYSVGLMRADTMGNVAWTKDYKIQGYTAAMSFAVMQLPYGYALSGYATSGNNRDLFVIATDHAGQVLWARKFGTPTTVEDLYQPFTPNAMAVGSDILLTGTRQSGGNSDILLARMDQNGNIDCLTNAPLTIQTTTVAPFSAVLNPQPVPDQITMSAIPAPVSVPLIQDLCPAIGLDLGSGGLLCDTITLDATTPNASYTWSTGSHDPSIEADAPGTYWVEVTVECCVYTDTVVFQPGPPPSAAFTVPGTTCDPLIAPTNTSTGATAYLWDFGDGTTATGEQPAHEYAAPGVYTISLTATSACGSDDATMDVEIIAMTGTLGITGPDTLCEGASGTYSAVLTGTTPASVLWSTGETTYDIQVSPDGPLLLQVDVEDANGCLYSAELPLEVSPSPSAAFQFNALRCDTLITFQDQSTHATTWHWDLGNGQASTLASPTGLFPGTGTYSVQLVAGNACGTDTVVQELVLGPEGALSLLGPDTLCSGETGTFTAQLQGAAMASVEWTPVTGDQSVIQATFNSNTLLGVTVTDDQHCRYTAMLPIAVIPAPDAGFTVLATPCDSLVSFTNTSSNAEGFLWELGNGATSEAWAPTIIIPEGDTVLVTLIAFNACGVDTARRQAWSDPGPVLQLLAPGRICSGDPFPLTLSYPSHLADILWSTGDTIMSINVVPVEGQTITVTAASDEGCLLSASYTVHFSGDGGSSPVYIPNVFTPNNDGINEVFMPVIEEGFLRLMIFNRWGGLIYETTQPDMGWRGDHGGRPVPDGTYVYILNWFDVCGNQERETIGHVTLLR